MKAFCGIARSFIDASSHSCIWNFSPAICAENTAKTADFREEKSSFAALMSYKNDNCSKPTELSHYVIAKIIKLCYHAKYSMPTFSIKTQYTQSNNAVM